jgi:formylglycine-generating enzyme required for sulfatase activity
MGDGTSMSQLPQNFVTWYQVVLFCNELSRVASLDTAYVGAGTAWSCDWDANGYRLPTEAEWEYACRAGHATALANGNISEIACGTDANLTAIGWYCGNSGDIHHPVGTKVSNDWSLFDMHGNVWEWCWDWWEDQYTLPAPDDPRGPDDGVYRVFRGGSFNADARDCRSAGRYRTPPGNSLERLGFRLARSAAN